MKGVAITKIMTEYQDASSIWTVYCLPAKGGLTIMKVVSMGPVCLRSCAISYYIAHIYQISLVSMACKLDHNSTSNFWEVIIMDEVAITVTRASEYSGLLKWTLYKFAAIGDLSIMKAVSRSLVLIKEFRDQLYRHRITDPRMEEKDE